MANRDLELEALRAQVNCAAVLEGWPSPWRLDVKESTKAALKYRHGTDEILIVNHNGRGWWDPQSERKGDVFSLVQFLDARLNFGQARQALRPFADVSPSYPTAERRKIPPDVPIAKRWSNRKALPRGSRAWQYLNEARALPETILDYVRKTDVVREGPHGSAWFAHRDAAGAVTHIDVRGATYKGSAKAGSKALFRMPGAGSPQRFVLAEAPIDALSLAAIEHCRTDTLYAATGGGMGPTAIREIERLLASMARAGDAVLCSATDANLAGERYAVQHEALAAWAGVAFARLRPPIADGDWNDILKSTQGNSL